MVHYFSTAALAFTLIVTAQARSAVRSPSYTFLPASDLHRRTLTGQTITFACYGGGGDCECPADNNGDYGALINVYPGFHINSGCTCPRDNNGDTGVLINQFTGYQCAYPDGACTWDYGGALQNTAQTNCPTSAKCQQPGATS
ncbi:hypothetical protein EW026_g4583 [Hermanssonia centrifuga]|uniref:Uncharacterized protein n=1 Tax=Hermanssonia centrifuga TaxID=98765 RepID=A0A4S4KHS1_9APHY|nr:hypothetical protein EW026_g4583 [Hermanssonia centrifuga]